MCYKEQRRIIGPVITDRILSKAADLARSRRCLLLTGGRSYESSGAKAYLEKQDEWRGVRRLEVKSPLPTSDELAHLAASAAKGSSYDVIIAVGGGKVLDLAKLLSLGIADPNLLLSHLPQVRKTARVIAIPTTAGSGAESTPFAVLYHGGVKHSIDLPALLPDLAIIDYRFQFSASFEVMLAAGMDAICQSIESLTARYGTVHSQSLAARALSLGVQSLGDALNGHRHAQKQMALASNLAGRAIAISRTTIPHALSYVLTSHYGIPHGKAVAVSMGPYLHWLEDQSNRTKSIMGIVNTLKSSLGVSDGNLHKSWKSFVNSLHPGLYQSLLAIQHQHGVEMLAEVNVQRLQNAIIPMQSGDLAEMLSSKL